MSQSINPKAFRSRVHSTWQSQFTPGCKKQYFRGQHAPLKLKMLSNLGRVKARLMLWCKKLTTAQQLQPRFKTVKLV